MPTVNHEFTGFQGLSVALVLRFITVRVFLGHITTRASSGSNGVMVVKSGFLRLAALNSPFWVCLMSCGCEGGKHN